MSLLPLHLFVLSLVNLKFDVGGCIELLAAVSFLGGCVHFLEACLLVGVWRLGTLLLVNTHCVHWKGEENDKGAKEEG